MLKIEAPAKLKYALARGGMDMKYQILVAGLLLTVPAWANSGDASFNESLTTGYHAIMANGKLRMTAPEKKDAPMPELRTTGVIGSEFLVSINARFTIPAENYGLYFSQGNVYTTRKQFDPASGFCVVYRRWHGRSDDLVVPSDDFRARLKDIIPGDVFVGSGSPEEIDATASKFETFAFEMDTGPIRYLYCVRSATQGSGFLGSFADLVAPFGSALTIKPY